MPETPLQAVERLMGALEVLVRQEHFLLNTGCYDEAADIRDREIPVVERLSELMALPGVSAQLDSSVRQRARAVMDAQQDQIAALTQQLATVKERLETVQNAQVRLSRMRPAYADPATAIGLSLAGTA